MANIREPKNKTNISRASLIPTIHKKHAQFSTADQQYTKTHVPRGRLPPGAGELFRNDPPNAPNMEPMVAPLAKLTACGGTPLQKGGWAPPEVPVMFGGPFGQAGWVGRFVILGAGAHLVLGVL